MAHGLLPVTLGKSAGTTLHRCLPPIAGLRSPGRGFDAGAAGFLLKDARPNELIAAVHAVASGDALIAPAVTRRLIEAFVAARPVQVPDDARVATLTGREREILLLLARGLSNREIAAEVRLSDATVKTHVASVLAKLGVRDRVRAVIVAYESGLVVPGGGP